MNTIEKISVSQLKNIGLEMSVLDDDIILSNNIEIKNKIFDTPCRLDGFVLLFCTNGEAEIQINFQEYKIHPGILVMNIPENVIYISNVNNLKVYPIVISSDFLKKMNIKMKDLMKLYVFAKKIPLVSLEYSEIMTLEKYYFLLEDIILISDSQSKKRNEEIFEAFIELLTRNEATERNLAYYADKIGITSNYLSKIVKEYTGRTAIEWIDEYVIFEAKTMIKHTQYTIQEIAYKLKFPSQSFFGKYFKRLTGMSPKQYKLS